MRVSHARTPPTPPPRPPLPLPPSLLPPSHRWPYQPHQPADQPVRRCRDGASGMPRPPSPAPRAPPRVAAHRRPACLPARPSASHPRQACAPLTSAIAMHRPWSPSTRRKGRKGGEGAARRRGAQPRPPDARRFPPDARQFPPPHPPPPPIHSHAPPPLRVPHTTTAQDAACSAAGRAGGAARPDAAGSARARTRGRSPFPGRGRGGASRPAAPAAPRAGVRGECAGRAVAVGRGAGGTEGKSSPSG